MRLSFDFPEIFDRRESLPPLERQAKSSDLSEGGYSRANARIDAKDRAAAPLFPTRDFADKTLTEIPGFGKPTGSGDSSNETDAKKTDFAGSQEQGKPEKNNSPGVEELSEAEKRVVEELKSRDREVRAHEAAHLAAGSGLVRGGASYSYQTGPDGKRYAIGGEVSIDISPVKDDPRATILKMRKVRSAALAPADPSAQDRAAAAKASQIESRARMELQQQTVQELKSGVNKNKLAAYKNAENFLESRLVDYKEREIGRSDDVGQNEKSRRFD